MTPFSYHAPQSLKDAVAILSNSSAGRLLSGGQTLLPRLREGEDHASDVIRIARLLPRGTKQQGDRLEIGAGSTHAEIAASTEVHAKIPALALLSAAVGDVQVRNRGMLGGALAANDPAGEYPAAALALDAIIVTDRREVAAGDFFSGAHKTSLEPSEIVVRVRFGIPLRASYRKVLDPAARWPMVGVMISEFSDGWRVAVTGAHREGAFRHVRIEEALNLWDFRGQPPTAVTDTNGIRDTPLGDPQYRRQLIDVLVKRNLLAILA